MGSGCFINLLHTTTTTQHNSMYWQPLTDSSAPQCNWMWAFSIPQFVLVPCMHITHAHPPYLEWSQLTVTLPQCPLLLLFHNHSALPPAHSLCLEWSLLVPLLKRWTWRGEEKKRHHVLQTRPALAADNVELCTVEGCTAHWIPWYRRYSIACEGLLSTHSVVITGNRKQNN